MKITIEVTDGHVDGYLTIQEFADKMYVDKHTVRQWMQRGKIQTIKIGYQVFIKDDTQYPEEKKCNRGRKRQIGINCQEERLVIFCKRLDEAMKLRNVSQADLATWANVLPQSMSRYLRGDSMPSLITAIKIADALNVSLDWLCGMDQYDREKEKEV